MSVVYAVLSTLGVATRLAQDDDTGDEDGLLTVGLAGALFSAAFVLGFLFWMATTYRRPIRNDGRQARAVTPNSQAPVPKSHGLKNREAPRPRDPRRGA